MNQNSCMYYVVWRYRLAHFALKDTRKCSEDMSILHSYSNCKKYCNQSDFFSSHVQHNRDITSAILIIKRQIR